MLPLLLSLAHAEAPSAAWAWSSNQVRRYVIEAYVSLPEPLTLPSLALPPARTDRFQVHLQTSCSAALLDPSGTTLVCTLLDVGLLAEPLPGEQGKLGPVLDELDARVTGAFAVVETAPDGHLRRLRLEGLTGKARGAEQVDRTLTWLVERAFVGLDLGTPGAPLESWAERDASLLTYLPRDRSAGMTLVQYTGALDGIHYRLQARGKGVIQADPLSARGDLGPPGGLSVTLAHMGTVDFGSSEGALLERRWSVLGRATAANDGALTAPRYPYAQGGWLTLLGPDAREGAALTGEMGAALPPGAGYQQLQADWAALEEALGGAALAPQ